MKRFFISVMVIFLFLAPVFLLAQTSNTEFFYCSVNDTTFSPAEFERAKAWVDSQGSGFFEVQGWTGWNPVKKDFWLGKKRREAMVSFLSGLGHRTVINSLIDLGVNSYGVEITFHPYPKPAEKDTVYSHSQTEVTTRDTTYLTDGVGIRFAVGGYFFNQNRSPFISAGIGWRALQFEAGYWPGKANVKDDINGHLTIFKLSVETEILEGIMVSAGAQLAGLEKGISWNKAMPALTAELAIQLKGKFWLSGDFLVGRECQKLNYGTEADPDYEFVWEDWKPGGQVRLEFRL